MAIEPFARFDDAGGETFGLVGCRGELVATTVGEVTGVLAEVERATRAGQWVAGFVSYEAAQGLDASLPVRARSSTDRLGAVPLAWFGVFDRRCAVSSGRPATFGWDLDATPAGHAGVVAEVKERIAAGMTYQVNLTARAHATVGDPDALYHSLVAAQGGTHSALVVTPDHSVACTSPELFFAVDGRVITCRPMKGTARRGRWPAEDEVAARALGSSAKERAENVMIVDLVRNDVGRIATFGSVTVPALFELERYPTMWQLTSTVVGRLPPEVRLVDVFAALFPSGSVTGAPKRSSMQAIADLETAPRGVYCGAVGVCAPGPELRARFAVAIRTATTNLATGYTEYGAGGGITWSSDPEAEWRELVAKTGILRGAPRIDGLFETMRFTPGGGYANLDAHLDRMAASATYAGLPFDRPTAVDALADAVEPIRVRLELGRDGQCSVTRRPLPAATDEAVRLGWCDERVDSTDVGLFHKTVDRDAYDRRRASRPDVDDVVMVNERGEVTETTIANLAVCLDGRWWTPEVGCGLLPGVERGRLLAEGVLAERVIRAEEVCRADDLAVVSSLRGWRRATLVDSASNGAR